MVRARCMRDDRQFSIGSGHLERHNTLLPGVDLYVVSYRGIILSLMGCPLGLIYPTVGHYMRV
jgi:hypothetical protein